MPISKGRYIIEAKRSDTVVIVPPMFPVYTITTLQLVVSEDNPFVNTVCMLTANPEKCRSILYSEQLRAEDDFYLLGLITIKLGRKNATATQRLIRHEFVHESDFHESQRLRGCITVYKRVLDNLKRAQKMWKNRLPLEARVAVKSGIGVAECRHLYADMNFPFEINSRDMEFLLHIFVAVCDAINMVDEVEQHLSKNK
ncbi:hypothetical protein QQ045_031559 [Rhodiola kirilowii]